MLSERHEVLVELFRDKATLLTSRVKDPHSRRNICPRDEGVRRRDIFIQQRSEPQPALIRVRIDPSTVIDEIWFDPRLETFARIDRERAIRDLGYEGHIVD